MLASLTLRSSLRVVIPTISAAAAVGGGTYFFLPGSSKNAASNSNHLEHQANETNGHRHGKPFSYVVAKVSAIENDAATRTPKLFNYDRQTSPNIVCSLEDSELSVDICDLFFVSKNNPVTKTINLEHTKGDYNSSSLIKNTSDLKLNDHVILKVTTTIKDLFVKSSKPIHIFNKANKEQKIGSLTYLFDLEKNNHSLNTTILSSSLFLMKVTEAASADIATSSSLKCKLSDEQTIDCKVYKLAAQPSSSESISQTTFEGLSAPITSKDDLAKGQYILVDLLDTKKTIADLETASVELQKDDATKVATAIFTDLLVGKLDAATPSQSIIYPTDKWAQHFTKTPTQHYYNYYVAKTKYVFEENAPQWTTFPTNLACKITDNNDWIIDEYCQIYEFDINSLDAFDLQNIDKKGKTVTTKEVINNSSLKLIRISNSIFEKLGAQPENISIDLINKDSEDFYWGNKYAILEPQYPVFDFEKSRLAIARVKTDSTASANIDSDSFTCQLSDKKETTCKVYDFSEAQYSNNISDETLKTIKVWDKTTSTLKKDRLFLIQLDKSIDFDSVSLQAPNIKLKDNNVDIVDFEIDQLVFGEINSNPKNLFTKKSNKSVYVVDLANDTTNWSSGTLLTDYRCVYESSGQKKYDDSCTLLPLPAFESNKKVVTHKQLIDLSTTNPSRSSSITKTDDRYVLLMDERKISGMTDENFTTAKIKLEKASTATDVTNNHYATATLKHKITDKDAWGLPEYIVGQIVMLGNSTNRNSCAWSVTDWPKFTCEVFDQTTKDTTSWQIQSFNTTALTPSTTLTDNQMLLIKVTEDVENIVWKKQRNFYYFDSSESDPFASEKAQTSLTNNMPLGGSHQTGQKMYELLKTTQPH